MKTQIMMQWNSYIFLFCTILNEISDEILAANYTEHCHKQLTEQHILV
jgi:hypothetical protein